MIIGVGGIYDLLRFFMYEFFSILVLKRLTKWVAWLGPFFSTHRLPYLIKNSLAFEQPILVSSHAYQPGTQTLIDKCEGSITQRFSPSSPGSILCVPPDVAEIY